MKIKKKFNEIALINTFINQLKKDISKSKKRNKRFSFVLTGGKSPIKLYKKLAKSKIDWSSVDLFWGDERHVSNKSKNSNYKLAYDTFIKKIKIKKSNLYKIDTNNNLNNSAQKYKRKIIKYFKNNKNFFDCVLLGMGEDGHIASIFPNSKLIKEKFVVKAVKRKDFNRITLSLNIINKSKKIILWLNSKFKSKIFDKYKRLGKHFPVNNLNRKKIIVFKIN